MYGTKNFHSTRFDPFYYLTLDNVNFTYPIEGFHVVQSILGV